MFDKYAVDMMDAEGEREIFVLNFSLHSRQPSNISKSNSPFILIANSRYGSLI